MTAMRVRVEQAIVSGNDLKIVTSRRRVKIYKTSSTVRRRDVSIHSVIKFSRNGPERRSATATPVSGVPLTEIAVPPPGNDVPSPFWENH